MTHDGTLEEEGWENKSQGANRLAIPGLDAMLKSVLKRVEKVVRQKADPPLPMELLG